MVNNIINQSIFDIVEHHSLLNPDSVAIEDVKRNTLTFRQLESQVRYTAKFLNWNGLGRNDLIAVMLPDGPEMAAAFLSVASCATCAPINPFLKNDELTFFLNDMNAKALITYQDVDPGVLKLVENLGIKKILLKPSNNGVGSFCLNDWVIEEGIEEVPASGQDTALILHTSGTTARPKMVPLTHSNLCQSALNISKSLDLNEGDRCLSIMPLFHIHGLIGCLLSSILAGSVVTCSQGFDATIFLKLLQDCSPTWYSAVPTLHQAILIQAKTVREGVKHNLRFIRSCSAALPPKLMSDLENVFGVPVIEAYGMTEASHQIAVNPLPPRRRKPRSVGVASGLNVSIIGEDGKWLGRDKLGEIVIRGPTVTRGYENNPDANTKAFIDEWFRTGDQGYIDEDGYIFLTDRIKEIINRGGEKISPREVDEVILTHPAVKQAVTFALPDDRLGEEVAAAVVIKENMKISEWELQKYISTKVAGFKVPRRLIFLEDIPKGPTGKIQRKSMAKELNVGKESLIKSEVGLGYKTPTGEVEKELAEIWSKVLKINNIGVRDDFFSLGGDSLRAEEIVAEVSERLGIGNLPIVIFIHAPTIEKMADLLSSEIPVSDSLLVCMQPLGVKSPLILIHACDGEILFLKNLVFHLGHERPIYAFRAPFLNGEKIPGNVIEEYASRYLKILTEKWGEGIINLAGVGPGGYIALEMAHHLKDKIGDVILLDMAHPKSPYVHLPIKKKLAQAFHGYRSFLVTYSRNRQLLTKLKNKIKILWKPLPRSISYGLQMERAYRKNHNPRVYESPVLLLIAENRSGFPKDPNVRINELKHFLRGKVESHVINGEHLKIFREPSAGKIAAMINDYLER